MAKFWIPKLIKGGNIMPWQGDLNGFFDNVTSIKGLDYVFYGNTGITGNINFPKLIKISGFGLEGTFYGCTGLNGNVNFPKLTTIYTKGLYNAFYGCTGIKELHFRADAKSIIMNTEGYSNKFGATNATIYFDL